MRTLKDLIECIQYDRSWGIWAELINGKFAPESHARYGRMSFENGGVLDGYVYFGNGENIQDFIAMYTNNDEDFTDEAIGELIDNYNQAL